MKWQKPLLPPSLIRDRRYTNQGIQLKWRFCGGRSTKRWKEISLGRRLKKTSVPATQGSCGKKTPANDDLPSKKHLDTDDAQKFANELNMFYAHFDQTDFSAEQKTRGKTIMSGSRSGQMRFRVALKGQTSTVLVVWTNFVLWFVMSSDVRWHIRDKPGPNHWCCS